MAERCIEGRLNQDKTKHVFYCYCVYMYYVYAIFMLHQKLWSKCLPGKRAHITQTRTQQLIWKKSLIEKKFKVPPQRTDARVWKFCSKRRSVREGGPSCRKATPPPSSAFWKIWFLLHSLLRRKKKLILVKLQNKKNKKYEAIFKLPANPGSSSQIYKQNFLRIFSWGKKGKFWLKVWGKNGTSLKAIFTNAKYFEINI